MMIRNCVNKSFQHACHRFLPKRHYTARRALLYVPGSDKKKIEKVPSLNVDCAVLDCEDGVAINRKVEARKNICEALNECNLGNNEIGVRVNPVDSPFCQLDLDAILKNKSLPSTLVLPKVESKDQIQWFAGEIKKLRSSEAQKTHRFNLILMVESARSLLDFRDICEVSFKLSETSPIKVEGVIFGSDDFCADIGATRTSGAAELLYARQKLVTVAKLFKIQAIDLVHIDYKDLDGLKQASEDSAKIGFTGKQVIHPKQIPIVQKAYSPTDDQITWATELINAFNEQQKDGKGAIVFQGSVIDMPLVLQAKNILQVANTVLQK